MDRNPVQTIQELYDAFGRRDIPKVFSLMSPNVEILQSEELPWGGHYSGHDGARQFFGKLGSHLNSTLAIERLFNSADHVVAVGGLREP
jgi:ketosteroid isomerase-like protein